MSDRPLTIAAGRWAMVSAGEYDRRRHQVAVNETVVDAVCGIGHGRDAVYAAIVAHEVAHAMATTGTSRADEERAARAAAVAAGGEGVVSAIERVLRMEADAGRPGR